MTYIDTSIGGKSGEKNWSHQQIASESLIAGENSAGEGQHPEGKGLWGREVRRDFENKSQGKSPPCNYIEQRAWRLVDLDSFLCLVHWSHKGVRIFLLVESLQREVTPKGGFVTSRRTF